MLTMTTRRWMVLVAAMALLLGSVTKTQRLLERRATCSYYAAYHAQREEFYRINAQEAQGREEFSDSARVFFKLADWHMAMRAKWERGASSTWQSVAPDPPMPSYSELYPPAVEAPRQESERGDAIPKTTPFGTRLTDRSDGWKKAENPSPYPSRNQSPATPPESRVWGPTGLSVVFCPSATGRPSSARPTCWRASCPTAGRSWRRLSRGDQFARVTRRATGRGIVIAQQAEKADVERRVVETRET